MPRRPRFTTEISFGHMMQATILVGGFIATFVVVKEQAADNETALRAAEAERTSLEIRLRAVENDQARADERFSSIIAYLTRIDGRLERIERDGTAR